MFRFDPDSSHVMPAHFGPRRIEPGATGWYHDVTAMTVPYVTDREPLAAHLPEPFEVGDEPIVTVFYARNRDVDWLAGRGYNMIGVTASAVYRGVTEELAGTFTLVVWENLTDPILTGRELQGIRRSTPTSPTMSSTTRAAGTPAPNTSVIRSSTSRSPGSSRSTRPSSRPPGTNGKAATTRWAGAT